MSSRTVGKRATEKEEMSMSQQALIWSRFLAAALQTHGAEAAAKKADEALAEYNKRFEVLAKYEAELAEMAKLLAVRNEQAGIGTQALMHASDLLEALKRDDKARALILDPPTSHWFHALKGLVDGNLRLVGHTYTTVPTGMNPDDPKLHRGSR
jgi:hypothetical protein